MKGAAGRKQLRLGEVQRTNTTSLRYNQPIPPLPFSASQFSECFYYTANGGRILEMPTSETRNFGVRRQAQRDAALELAGKIVTQSKAPPLSAHSKFGKL